MEARLIAKWFICHNYDNPRNTLKGNKKLQKLLYFAQLIHLAKHNKTLFEDPIFAYKNGSVVEDIRLKYKRENGTFVNEAYQASFDLPPEALETLYLTETIFGDASVDELSELNHQHKGWEIAFLRSKIRGEYVKELAEISIEDIVQYDIQRIKDMIEIHGTISKKQGYIEIKGVKYFYDPREIQMNDEIKKELETFPAEEKAYQLYNDKNQGLIVF
ncbi:MAG TPA: hypothetical protein DD789_00010 [Firmicutes bacterium]|jgi:uncharacterized phage-associated protein|nr:hypothetical protein [Bacillota bacterium]